MRLQWKMEMACWDSIGHKPEYWEWASKMKGGCAEKNTNVVGNDFNNVWDSIF